MGHPFLEVRPRILLVSVIAMFITGFGLAQWRGRRPGFRRPPPDRNDYPTWEIDPDFAGDVFTFVRVEYDSVGRGRWWCRWDNDYPSGDWNFSFRLQQLTSLHVDPNGRVLRLTDPELFNHPFIYMAAIGRLSLSEAEAKCLRRYLLNGGFLMVDDFWTRPVWEHLAAQMKLVFPHREPRELSLDHEIFHNVYDFKQKPQVTDIQAWRRGLKFEPWSGDSEGDEDPHFWGFFDDAGRLMALLCHNNDIGDGWEREGEDSGYFREYSEQWAYPLGINVITYAMTH